MALRGEVDSCAVSFVASSFFKGLKEFQIVAAQTEFAFKPPFAFKFTQSRLFTRHFSKVEYNPNYPAHKLN